MRWHYAAKLSPARILDEHQAPYADHADRLPSLRRATAQHCSGSWASTWTRKGQTDVRVFCVPIPIDQDRLVTSSGVRLKCRVRSWDPLPPSGKEVRMRRKLPLFVLVGVAGVLVPVLALLAQSSSTPCASACCSQASGTASKSSAPSATDAKIIDELVAILKETKSEETFIVTAMALGRMGPEAKRALPQLIRNAERLELFEDLFDANAAAGDRQVVRQVAEAIMMLAETSKDGRPTGYGYPTAPMPWGNSLYGTPSVVGGWNQPAVAPPAVAPCPTATCPVPSAPFVPGTASTPGYVPTPSASAPTLDKNGGDYGGPPTPSAPAPTPSPAVKKASSKGGKSRAPVAPPPSPPR